MYDPAYPDQIVGIPGTDAPFPVAPNESNNQPAPTTETLDHPDQTAPMTPKPPPWLFREVGRNRDWLDYETRSWYKEEVVLDAMKKLREQGFDRNITWRRQTDADKEMAQDLLRGHFTAVSGYSVSLISLTCQGRSLESKVHKIRSGTTSVTPKASGEIPFVSLITTARCP